MRALLLSTAVLFAVNAEAATPSGCYATYSNPNFCYGGEIDTYYQNDNDNIVQYGITVGALVNDLKFTLNNFNVCNASLNQTQGFLDSCHSIYEAKNADYNTCASNYSGLYNYSQGQTTAIKKLNSTIKTLKRKCGSRCR